MKALSLIADDACLLTFSNILAQAQAAAEVEKGADVSKKWQRGPWEESASLLSKSQSDHCWIKASFHQFMVDNDAEPTNCNKEIEEEIISLLHAPTSVSKTLSICDL